MEFPRRRRTMDLLDPRRGFERSAPVVEYRQDPLTGSCSRINVDRATRPRQEERAAQACFFCPENVEQQTPRFPEDLCPGGRIARGEALVFPNLHPFAEYHAVGTLTRRHFLELSQFTPRMVADNLRASQEYLGCIRKKTPEVTYPLWNWNHLPPSGASLIHPHVQIIADRAPTPELARLLYRSEQYLAKYRVSYWEDLLREEKARGERYIGEVGSVVLLASFAPRGNREVMLICQGVSSLLELEESHVADFAGALIGVLKAYQEMGANSFNVTIFSGPVDRRLEHFRLQARIISRPVFQPSRTYTNDCGFMERFHDEWVIETLPEDVAVTLRGHLGA